MSWRARIACALAVVALAGLATACGDSGATTREEGRRLNVVVSLSLLADLVREVGAERVDVFALLPPGADPHTFEPTPRDAQRLSEADVVFINGLGLEAALEKVIQANVPSTLPLIRLAEKASTLPNADPHLWLSVENATAYLNAILGALSEADPVGASRYRNNFDRYSNQLSELDGEVRQAVAAIPPERRLLVTYHDSYRYLAQEYGLEVVGVLATSPGQDPSPRHLADLLAAIRDRGVPAVFVEPQFKASTLERLADEAGVSVCTLYSDALDDQVRTYVDMMRFNANELARCLGDIGGY